MPLWQPPSATIGTRSASWEGLFYSLFIKLCVVTSVRNGVSALNYRTHCAFAVVCLPTRPAHAIKVENAGWNDIQFFYNTDIQLIIIFGE